MSTKNNGGPAFAATTTVQQDVDWEKVPDHSHWSSTRDLPQITTIKTSGGMSLRDWFAGQAASGLQGDPVDAAEWAYRFADAMLAEREKP